MEGKNSAKVVIDGKIVMIGGYESEEYFQKIAGYINKKIAQMEEAGVYRKLSPQTRSNLLAINIADDYFKAKEFSDGAQQEIENKDKETYDVKQDLVSAKLEIERLKKELASHNNYNNNSYNNKYGRK